MNYESEDKQTDSNLMRSCLACGKEFPAESQFCPADGSPLTLLNIDPLVGSFFAERYQIIEVLGRGGMSAVYKAKHVLMDRIVAIKILVRSDVPSLKRFQLEAKLVSSLKHHNIVTVYDFGVSFKGQPYLVMDYLEGSNLMQEIRRVKRLDLARAMKIFLQACDALSYAHKRDLIHRDLKPSNFMLIEEEDQPDVVKLVDFGIAKQLKMSMKEMEQLTKTGQILGSPLYMSPEQCMGNKLDARSDIYSLGCVMYESLTGKPPLLGANTLDTLQRHIHDTPLAFVHMDPELTYLPDDLEQIVLKCLRREPDDRYQSAAAVGAELAYLRTQLNLSEPILSLPSAEIQTDDFSQSESKATLEQDSSSTVQIGKSPASAPSPFSFSNSSRPANASRFSWSPVIAAVSTAVAAALLFIFFYPKPQPVSTTSTISNWKELNEKGETEFDKGHYQLARNYFEQACDVAEDYDRQDPRYATSLSNLGSVYFKQDFYPEAEKTIKKVLAIRTEIFGQNGLPMADSLNDLAMVYLAQSKPAQAEPLMIKALSIRKNSAGSDSLEYADSLKAMASIYNKTGRVDQAMKALQTALAIRKKKLGNQAPDVAETENSLAMDYQMKGDLKQARALYKDAYVISSKTLGSEHPLLAESLVGLGTLDYLQNDYSQAENMFNQALKIRKKSLGDKNLRTGEVLSCLAILKQAQGDQTAAAALFKRSLEIKETAFGPQSPEVARSLKVYAQTLRKLGRAAEASKLDKRVREIETDKS